MTDVVNTTSSSDPVWSSWCAVISQTNGSAVIGTDVLTTFAAMAPIKDLPSTAVVSPAAVSVQVMNTEALQTTSGILYLGRSTAQLQLSGDTRTWAEWADDYISFMNPRLCSAAKLALRGIQMDGYPTNMSAISDFRPTSSGATTQDNWDQSTGIDAVPDGFTPLVIVNPDNVNIRLLICIEWRVRFDLTNPAASSHRQYPVASDLTYSNLMAKASSLGNGAMDIAEKVAILGTAAATVAPLIAL